MRSYLQPQACVNVNKKFVALMWHALRYNNSSGRLSGLARTTFLSAYGRTGIIVTSSYSMKSILSQAIKSLKCLNLSGAAVLIFHRNLAYADIETTMLPGGASSHALPFSSSAPSQWSVFVPPSLLVFRSYGRAVAHFGVFSYGRFVEIKCICLTGVLLKLIVNMGNVF